MNPAMQPPQPASSTLVGYARVSTASQAESLAEQHDRLHQLGAVRVLHVISTLDYRFSSQPPDLSADA